MSRFAKVAIAVAVSMIIPCMAAKCVRAADECCPPLATVDSPIRYFDGNSFSFLSPCPSVSCYPSYAVPNAYPQVSTTYYTPGFYSRSYSAKIVPPPTLAVLLHPGGRLHAGILQLLLHARILSVLVIFLEVLNLFHASGMAASLEIRLQPDPDHAVDQLLAEKIAG